MKKPPAYGPPGEAVLIFPTRKMLYTGVSVEDDLRNRLEALAEALIADRPPTRSQLRDASDVLRRVAALKRLAKVFPEQLSHRQQTGKRFWMVVDALMRIDESGQDDQVVERVARAWNVEPDTVRKRIRELGEFARWHVLDVYESESLRLHVDQVRRILASED